MKNQPKVIYLQIDADGDKTNDFGECLEVSWCSDKIHESDLVYYSKEYVDKLRREAFEAGADVRLCAVYNGFEIDREFETFEDYIKHKKDANTKN